MNGTLILKNPIMVNGEKISEMEYDTEEITGEIFTEMESKHRAAAGHKSMAMCEVDAGLHLYMGYAAIIAVNPKYDVSDLLRLKGVDVAALLRIGRNFINPPADSQENNSEERAGITQGSTTPVRKNSEEES